MLYLYVQAPFAAFRPFTAGWYRPSATFLTPSAAYGLVLNLAGIESRLREGQKGHDDRTPATLTQPGLPKVRLALGAVPAPNGDVFPHVQTVFQQLHNYPVGASGKARAELTKGNKYNITPVRREVLVGLRASIVIDNNTDLEDRVRRGLAGEFNLDRYGIPFLGDNQFLIDRLEERTPPISSHWFEKLSSSQGKPRPHTTRMTICINRADMSRTVSALYAPTIDAIDQIPEKAWTDISPPEQ